MYQIQSFSQTEQKFEDDLEDLQEPTAYRLGLYLDDTDNRRDPYLGYRIQYERYGIIQTDDNFGSGYQNDLKHVTTFTPFRANTFIWVWNVFLANAIITSPATINREDYLCENIAIDEDECTQTELDGLYDNRKDEANKGNATALGGTQRLRAYPQGRFYDSNTLFFGTELRWNFLRDWQPFNYTAQKGIYSGLQLAFFQEFGQVAEEFDNTLLQEMKSSTGAGIRVILNNVILRFDTAYGTEGINSSFFIGYPF